jgi:dATP pyrophosphohydrolase
VAKRPESVLVVVHTRAGQVLMLERIRPRGYWQSVTGSLEWGELPAQAARRELAEETGLVGLEPRDRQRSNRFEIMGQWSDRYAPGVKENLEHVFTLELDDCVEIRLDPREHCRYRWMERQEAAERAFSWSNRDAILDFVPAGPEE